MDKTVFERLKDSIIDLDINKAPEIAEVGIDDAADPF